MSPCHNNFTVSINAIRDGGELQRLNEWSLSLSRCRHQPVKSMLDACCRIFFTHFKNIVYNNHLLIRAAIGLMGLYVPYCKQSAWVTGGEFLVKISDAAFVRTWMQLGCIDVAGRHCGCWLLHVWCTSKQLKCFVITDAPYSLETNNILHTLSLPRNSLAVAVFQLRLR